MARFQHDFFLGSVSRRVLAESQCDVLIAS